MKKERTHLWSGVVTLDESFRAAVAAAQPCRRGKDYFTCLHPRQFNLPCYGPRLPIIWRRKLPEVGRPVFAAVYNVREWRAPCKPREYTTSYGVVSYPRWGEDPATPEQIARGEYTIREFTTLSIAPSNRPEPPALHVWLAAAGYKYTINGAGNEWSASIDHSGTTLFSTEASCRSGRYGVRLEIGVSETPPSVSGRLFAAARPCWMP